MRHTLKLRRQAQYLQVVATAEAEDVFHLHAFGHGVHHHGVVRPVAGVVRFQHTVEKAHPHGFAVRRQVGSRDVTVKVPGVATDVGSSPQAVLWPDAANV